MSDEKETGEEGFDEVGLCRNNLISYCIAQYPSFSFPKHILIMAHYLELVAKGKINRLMIFAPPRHGKSELVSKLFPPWYIGYTHGKNTVAVATYGQELSNEIGTSLNNRMNSDTYKEIFPEATPSNDSNAKGRLVTVNGGGYIAVGIGGALTGKGAHLRILDDPNKNREEAESDIEQKKQWDWWTSVFMTRGEQEIQELGTANKSEDSPVVIILTRWSDKDIARRLLDKQKEEEEAGIAGDKWVILNLPAIAEDENDALGRPVAENIDDWTTWKDENALWPEKYSARQLAKLRLAVGIRDWNALFQQRPSSATGDVYKRDRWQFYQELPEGISKPVQSWDMNYKDTGKSDFAVGFVASIYRKTSIYLRDRFKGRWTLAQACDKVKEAKLRYPDTTAIYIEEKANGLPVIQTVQKEVPGVIAVEPRVLGSKNARNEAAAKYQNAGNFYLPLGAAFNDDVIETTAAWPNGKYDDDCDAIAQLALMELGQQSLDGLLRAMEKELASQGVDVQQLEVTPDDPFSVYADPSQIKKIDDVHDDLYDFMHTN